MVTLKNSQGGSVTLSDDGFKLKKKKGRKAHRVNLVTAIVFISLYVYSVYLCHFVTFSLSHFQLFLLLYSISELKSFGMYMTH